jgi:hypothetical protein
MNSARHSASDVFFLLHPASKHSGISRGVKPTHDGWRPSGTFSNGLAERSAPFHGMNRALELQIAWVYGGWDQCANMNGVMNGGRPLGFTWKRGKRSRASLSFRKLSGCRVRPFEVPLRDRGHRHLHPPPCKTCAEAYLSAKEFP